MSAVNSGVNLDNGLLTQGGVVHGASEVGAFLAGDGMKKRLVTGSRIRVRSTPLEEWYSRIIKQEYQRLKSGDVAAGSPTGLAEVKLRLFLSLLDQPVVNQTKLVANSK